MDALTKNAVNRALPTEVLNLNFDSESFDEEISPDRIVIPSYQPRYYVSPNELESLADSIRESGGVLESVLVRPSHGGKYELVYGQRRLLASRQAGMATIRARVQDLNDDEAITYALAENLLRVDLNPVEVTDGVLRLLSVRLKREIDSIVAQLQSMYARARKGKLVFPKSGGDSHVEGIDNNVIATSEEVLIASTVKEFGRFEWQSFVSNYLPLLKLPEDVLEQTRQGNLAYTKARELGKVEDRTLRQELLAAVIAEEWTLTQIKGEIAKQTERKKTTTEYGQYRDRLQMLSKKMRALERRDRVDGRTWNRVKGLVDSLEDALDSLV